MQARCVQPWQTSWFRTDVRLGVDAVAHQVEQFVDYHRYPLPHPTASARSRRTGSPSLNARRPSLTILFLGVAVRPVEILHQRADHLGIVGEQPVVVHEVDGPAPRA